MYCNPGRKMLKFNGKIPAVHYFAKGTMYPFLPEIFLGMDTNRKIKVKKWKKQSI